MSVNGWVAFQGAMAGLDHLTGRKSALETEWEAKAAPPLNDPSPKTSYLMLLSAMPTDTQTDINTLKTLEVSGTGYARQPVVWAQATTAANVRSVSSQELVQFGPFTDAGSLPAQVVAAALVTRQTTLGATPPDLCLMVWKLPTPVTPVQNQAIQIASGALKMELAV
jgi:hypothetical protein